MASDAAEMDPAAVRSVADQLDGLRNRLIDGTRGTLNDLIARSSMVTASEAFGRWETARQVRAAYLEAYERTAEGYQMVIDQLAVAADTLRVEAAEFEGVDTEAASLLGDGAANDVVVTPGMPGRVAE